MPEAYPFDVTETDRLLSTTRAVRRRLDFDRPVDPAIVLDCIRLAIQAPTASNGQTWRWIVVTDAAKRAEIGRVYRELGADQLAHMARIEESPQTRRVYEGAAALASILDRVPVHVIPCIEGNLDRVPLGVGASMYGSILPAVWSLQLALRSRGLGSVWTTLHLFRAQEVADLLGIPEGVSQVALLPVAHTIGTDFKPARRRPVEEITYWDHWGATR